MENNIGGPFGRRRMQLGQSPTNFVPSNNADRKHKNNSDAIWLEIFFMGLCLTCFPHFARGRSGISKFRFIGRYFFYDKIYAWFIFNYIYDIIKKIIKIYEYFFNAFNLLYWIKFDTASERNHVTDQKRNSHTQSFPFCFFFIFILFFRSEITQGHYCTTERFE